MRNLIVNRIYNAGYGASDKYHQNKIGEHKALIYYQLKNQLQYLDVDIPFKLRYGSINWPMTNPTSECCLL
ncbi:17079_t:CDS:2 [Gigaspora rosea]|nr:17079_t:CDS:2 [Gigaspora rosea]